jgi:hypothetical protein
MKVQIIPNQSVDLDERQLMMLHAKTSRSKDSLSARIEAVKSSDPSVFFKKWIVDYKHESILDMGTIDIIIDDLTHREALYLFMHPQVSGIEASTRYIDWTIKSPVSPLYSEIMAYMRDLVKDEKHLNHLPFDVARGFISANDLTNVNLKVSLRVARSFVYELRPVAPELSDGILTELIRTFPDLGFDQPPAHYVDVLSIYNGQQLPSGTILKSGSDDFMKYTVSVDYGCYRDLRRHRPLYHVCPSWKPGPMHPFYLHYLSEDLLMKVNTYLITERPILLGMVTTVEFSGIPKYIEYMLDTRTASTSHPILRSLCLAIREKKDHYEVDYTKIKSIARSQQESLYC